MDTTLADLAAAGLKLRFMVAYPALVGFGFILGLIALGRMRMLTNGRRMLYCTLASASFAMCWTGIWGLLGIWQYGLVTDQALPVSRSMVSLGFSSAMLWLAVSLAATTWCIAREEIHFTRAKKALSLGDSQLSD